MEIKFKGIDPLKPGICKKCKKKDILFDLRNEMEFQYPPILKSKQLLLCEKCTDDYANLFIKIENNTIKELIDSDLCKKCRNSFNNLLYIKYENIDKEFINNQDSQGKVPD